MCYSSITQTTTTTTTTTCPSHMMQYFALINALYIEINTISYESKFRLHPGGGGEVLPYISYIGMCRPKGYGF